MTVKLLVVDDEPDNVEIIVATFEHFRPQYIMLRAESGKEAIAVAAQEKPDLVILDVAMPGMDGFDTSQHLRQIADFPIIFLTARTLENDKIKGLNLGDDYVTKPFSHKELVARVDTVLRRTHSRNLPESLSTFKHRDLEVDFARQQVLVKSTVVAMTPLEFKILAYMVQNAGRVVTQEDLLTHVWGPAYKDASHYLKVYVRRLREKIEENPAMPNYILTSRGVGYIFTTDMPNPA